MPQLNWNELDVTSYLAVMPEIEEDKISHTYNVSASGLSLEMTIWQYESVVHFTLKQDGLHKALTSFVLVVRGEMLYRDEKWGEYLEFCDCILAPRRYYSIDLGDVFNRVEFPSGITVQLKVRPQIQISFLQNAA